MLPILAPSRLAEYHSAVFRLARWAIDAVVTLFALYAFAFVPLGNQTGFQHLRDILATEEAREAGRGLLDAAERLRNRLVADFNPIETPGQPVLPELRTPGQGEEDRDEQAKR